ncbi:MAG: cell division protein FtsA, partial [Candidatus Omnitrophica bacterium]|nr:cell division protein FtsA [Candidatus Omnitrophota bacterium]
MYPDIVCGLDIGASSIRALIAGPEESRPKAKKNEPFHAREKILGFAESHTRGFSKGVVSNLSLVSDAIEEAVSKAEAIARCKVRKVIANISGMHIRTFKSRGSIHISDRPSEITERDLKRCIESAKLIAMSLDREVIHLVPERFYIDDKMEISEPLGLFGSKLDVDLNIITSLVSVLQNLTKAVNMAGYEVEDLVTSGSGTSLAIFDNKELDEGAVIIDIGKDHTEASLFMNQKLRDSYYFPFGSNDLTVVLQEKLRIMFEEAEELRIRHGVIAKEGQDFFDNSEV